MAQERELIIKLGQKITDRIGHKVTVEDPEYYGLACVVTDEMAEVALAMKVRVPTTPEAIAKKCGKSVELTHQLMEEMSVIGLLNTTGKMRTITSSTSCPCSYRAVRNL